MPLSFRSYGQKTKKKCYMRNSRLYSVFHSSYSCNIKLICAKLTIRIGYSAIIKSYTAVNNSDLVLISEIGNLKKKRNIINRVVYGLVIPTCRDVQKDK